jgi:hypothetical protein
MRTCSSCGATGSIFGSIFHRDLFFPSLCQDCQAARKRRVPVEQIREEREAKRRNWLQQALRYYSGTSIWPRHRFDEFDRTKAVVNGQGFTRFLLSVGQIVSVLLCVATLVNMFRSFEVTQALAKALPGSVNRGAFQLWIVLGSTLLCFFWCAMFVVFGRAKWVARLVECQEAIITQLLQELETQGERPVVQK